MPGHASILLVAILSLVLLLLSTAILFGPHASAALRSRSLGWMIGLSLAGAAWMAGWFSLAQGMLTGH